MTPRDELVLAPEAGLTSTVAAPRAPLAGRALLRLLSPGGRNGLTILIYHRVLAQPDPLFPGEVGSADFHRQLGQLRASFTVLPLTEAVQALRDGTLPPRAACITFDDGYADNAEVALPILRQHGVSATFFVASGFLDGGRMWNDTVIELVRRTEKQLLDASVLGLGIHRLDSIETRRQAISSLIGQLKYRPMEQRLETIGQLCALAPCALADDLMMRSEQVRELHRAGMEIGAHTVNHPILAALPAAQARHEISAGKAALETITGAPVRIFAYPNGKPGVDYLAEHVAMVREIGFDGAVSTAWGGRNDDLFQLPRFTPWDRDTLRFQLRLAQNLARRAARV